MDSPYKPAPGFRSFYWSIIREHWKSLLGVVGVIASIIGFVDLLASFTKGEETSDVLIFFLKHRRATIEIGIAMIVWIILIAVHRKYAKAESVLESMEVAGRCPFTFTFTSERSRSLGGHRKCGFNLIPIAGRVPDVYCRIVRIESLDNQPTPRGYDGKWLARKSHASRGSIEIGDEGKFDLITEALVWKISPPRSLEPHRWHLLLDGGVQTLEIGHYRITVRVMGNGIAPVDRQFEAKPDSENRLMAEMLESGPEVPVSPSGEA